jgi:hypothetical protein
MVLSSRKLCIPGKKKIGAAYMNRSVTRLGKGT